MINSFRDLTVWQRAIELTKTTYKICQSLPKEELFGLVAQMKRSAISVPSNIAEGSRRQTLKEYQQFLYIALGSISELETQYEIAYQLDFINKNTYDNCLEKIQVIGKMLRKLIVSLKG